MNALYNLIFASQLTHANHARDNLDCVGAMLASHFPLLQIQVFQAADDPTSAWQILQLAKMQTGPQIIYTSSRSEPAFIEQLRQPFEAIITVSDTDELKSVTPQVRLEKASSFNHEQVNGGNNFRVIDLAKLYTSRTDQLHYSITYSQLEGTLYSRHGFCKKSPQITKKCSARHHI